MYLSRICFVVFFRLILNEEKVLRKSACPNVRLQNPPSLCSSKLGNAHDEKSLDCLFRIVFFGGKLANIKVRPALKKKLVKTETRGERSL